KDNLYKLWNRMSSGSYFPPPVRTVKIPKASGGERKLGIPTVADRIAQTVVKAKLEPQIEPLFHPNSFGYRPGQSALDAVGQARRNCWDYDWVLDLDVRGFFDNLDWELLMKAVTKHAQDQWVVLYIERWLKTPAQEEDGTLVERTSGTPQGGVMTPRTQKVIFVLDSGGSVRGFTYETLKKGANRLVCYDRSGQPGQQPFAVECTSIANLDRAAQNLKLEAQVVDKKAY